MKKFSKFIKSLDVFGAKVLPNFRGESNYKTTVGGLISIAINFILAFLVIELLI